MPDITLISAALTSLKAAIDIAKFLRETDQSLENAELKLKLADLVVALADAKIRLVEVQDALTTKDQRIAELEAAFEIKDGMVRRYDAYYSVDGSGRPIGVPFCLRCWEVEHKRRQLVNDANRQRTRVCTACGHQYNWQLAREIRADESNT
ncbi:MAG: hypothetical protein HYV59_15635 [Planctomycetes bacterium]|nr:hypothetical protein [Planctomycetota bacterium]